jgi:hypothetical protein
MSRITKLTCSSCGAKLETTHEDDRFICAYCGIEYAVSRGIGSVSIHPILGVLEDVRLRPEKISPDPVMSSSSSEVEEIRREIDLIEASRTRGQIKSYFYGGMFILAGLFLLCPASSIMSLGETGTGVALISLSAISVGIGVYVVARKVVTNRNLDQQLNELEEDLAHKVSDLQGQK